MHLPTFPIQTHYTLIILCKESMVFWQLMRKYIEILKVNVCYLWIFLFLHSLNKQTIIAMNGYYIDVTLQIYDNSSVTNPNIINPNICLFILITISIPITSQDNALGLIMHLLNLVYSIVIIEACHFIFYLPMLLFRYFPNDNRLHFLCE